MASVVHFEIEADDPQRAIKFYSETFGWKIDKWEGEEGGYWLVKTEKKDGIGIDGAIMPRESKSKESAGYICTIGVENIEETRKKVMENGGSHITEVREIPYVGQFCYCKDTEGNQFGLMQPLPMDQQSGM